ncbi:uncharacterized protein LOC110025923 [Phalaenopsis equestris]|uniref:uncharacterized protein LOC110025923 n=1 Tax=Phalaenopsis equestris TaxID=78828 RepID=UPI0009E2D8E1|nr:uncharacterized protein LOC110025923 [Phalaenopsis equestris]
MQGVTASWIGQSFALPQCNAARQNKSRSRRTKEERRTLVVSFIKKYQSSHDGKFPSLNLTHKEVGGSFYTIREIVRDIIQENKVLGPGNPTSKLLNLEFYSEEEVDDGKLCISTIDNGINHAHFDDDFSMEPLEVSNEENISTHEPGSQVKFKTDLNENFSSQEKNGETHLIENSANGSVLHENLVYTGMKESNVQPNSPVDIGVQYAKQTLSLYPTVSGNFLVGSEQKDEDRQNKISVITQCFEESTNISGTSVTKNLLGTSMHFTDTVDDQSNRCRGHNNHEVLTLVEDKLDQDGSSETVAPTVLSNVSRSACSEIEQFGSNREIDFYSEQGIDAAEGKNVDSLVLQTTRFPVPRATENDIQPVDKSGSSVGTVRESENALSKLLEPVIEEADHLDVKSEKQSDAFRIVNGGGFMSSSNEETAAKKSLVSEPNPFWGAIKSFISSFIKFWSE